VVVMVAEHQILEIRTYRLRPGAQERFRRLAEQSTAALARYGVTVVDFGPSRVAEDGHEDFYLMRAFASLAEREQLEAAFYGGREWREQWRDDILACIESFHTVVINTTPDAVAALSRRAG
jgi:hypothetical protein